MTTPADVLRCAECGIADQGVRDWGEDGYRHNCAGIGISCLAAALALLEQARPYVQKELDRLAGAEGFSSVGSEMTARALLAKFPVKP